MCDSIDRLAAYTLVPSQQSIPYDEPISPFPQQPSGPQLLNASRKGTKTVPSADFIESTNLQVITDDPLADCLHAPIHRLRAEQARMTADFLQKHAALLTGYLTTIVTCLGVPVVTTTCIVAATAVLAFLAVANATAYGPALRAAKLIHNPDVQDCYPTHAPEVPGPVPFPLAWLFEDPFLTDQCEAHNVR